MARDTLPGIVRQSSGLAYWLSNMSNVDKVSNPSSTIMLVSTASPSGITARIVDREFLEGDRSDCNSFRI